MSEELALAFAFITVLNNKDTVREMKILFSPNMTEYLPQCRDFWDY